MFLMLGDSIATEMQDSLWFTLSVETNHLICMYQKENGGFSSLGEDWIENWCGDVLTLGHCFTENNVCAELSSWN